MLYLFTLNKCYLFLSLKVQRSCFGVFLFLLISCFPSYLKQCFIVTLLLTFAFLFLVVATLTISSSCITPISTLILSSSFTYLTYYVGVSCRCNAIFSTCPYFINFFAIIQLCLRLHWEIWHFLRGCCGFFLGETGPKKPKWSMFNSQFVFQPSGYHGWDGPQHIYL